MKIENGERRRLVIDGVFEGEAGVSRGRLAFIPNRFSKQPERALGGLLDGDPVRLAIVREGAGPVYSARFEVLS